MPYRTMARRAVSAAVGDIQSQLGEVERGAIAAALEAHGDNQTRAARALGPRGARSSTSWRSTA